MDDNRIRRNIADRLTDYRKLNGFTQAELAERINYSDKSISKWERGDGVPDIFVLALLAEIYGVEVNDFLSNEPPKSKTEQNKTVKQNMLTPSVKLLITILSAGIVWLVASVVFFALKLALPEESRVWFVFVCAVPAAAIVLVVFSGIWGRLLYQCLSVSLLIWSAAITISLLAMVKGILWIFLIAAVLQVLTILWFTLRRHIIHFTHELIGKKRSENGKNEGESREGESING